MKFEIKLKNFQNKNERNNRKIITMNAISSKNNKKKTAIGVQKLTEKMEEREREIPNAQGR